MTTNFPVKRFDSGVSAAAKHGAYYNGFYFPSNARFKKYSRAVYSDNGRTIKRRNLVISIEFEFFPEDYTGDSFGATTSLILENISQALEVPGKVFCIAEGGVGNYCVNATKSLDTSVFPAAFTGLTGRMVYCKDLDGGPKPKLTVFDPFAGGGTSGQSNSVRMVWEVELAINTCGNWPGPDETDSDGWKIASGTPIDVVAEIEYAVVEGLNVRNIDLEVELVNLYEDTNSRGLEKSLDAYAIQYANAIPTLLGHKRTITRKLRPDGKTLSVRLVDSQIDSYSPYPVGIRQISLTTKYESGIDSGAFDLWDAEINYEASVYPGVPKYYAWEPFFKFFQLQVIREAAIHKPGGFNGQRRPIAVDQQNPNQQPLAEGIKYIRHMTLGPNDFYDTKVRVKLDYVTSFDLTKLLAISGCLDPLMLNTWEAWNASTVAQHQGDGVLGLRQTRTHTDVATICGGTVSNFDTTVNPKTVAALVAVLSQTKPPPDKSWLDFKYWFDYYDKENVVQLPKAVRVTPPQDDPTQPNNFGRNQQLPAGAQQLPSEKQAALLSPVVQVSANGEQFVRFYGQAHRLGYPILVPMLTMYQGRTATRIRTDVLRTGPISAVMGGIPIYEALWDVTYKLDGVPNGDHRFTKFSSPVPLLNGSPMAGG